MKYFIDFEATQYTNEIIQVGCVREDGKVFQSLIRPRKLDKVTKWITQLTGITRSDLANASSSDDVFENFYAWLLSDRTPVKFFCYGGSDFEFVRNNIEKCTHSIRAQMALSMIFANMTDVTILVREHFNVSAAPALKKVMMYYFPNDNHECHDAESDADMLRLIYNAMQREGKLDGVPKVFEKYLTLPALFTNSSQLAQLRIVKSREGAIYEKYDSLDLAAQKTVDEIMTCHSLNMPNEGKVKSRILAAINNKSQYCGYDWTVEVKTI